MVIEDYLAQEFTLAIASLYPELNPLLEQCYLKVVERLVRRLSKRFYCAVIYSPESLFPEIKHQQPRFREVARSVGMTDAVCINATPLVRDPLSKLKQEDHRLWLELHWLLKSDS